MKELPAFGVYCLDFNIGLPTSSSLPPPQTVMTPPPFLTSLSFPTSPSATPLFADSVLAHFPLILHPWVWEDIMDENFCYKDHADLQNFFNLNPQLLSFCHVVISDLCLPVPMKKPVFKSGQELNMFLGNNLKEQPQGTTANGNKSVNSHSNDLKSITNDKSEIKSTGLEDTNSLQCCIKPLKTRLQTDFHGRCTRQFVEVLAAAVARRVSSGKTPSSCSKRCFSVDKLASELIRGLSAMPRFAGEAERDSRCEALSHNSASERCNHSKVSILFSGGIDSFIISYLATRSLTGVTPRYKTFNHI